MNKRIDDSTRKGFMVQQMCQSIDESHKTNMLQKMVGNIDAASSKDLKPSPPDTPPPAELLAQARQPSPLDASPPEVVVVVVVVE